ncbi:WhiB family transcriptional regulator [Streptomyces sp. V4I23]|uniref:WhiB family transcriptional regulator n=1 Tax=Streptomyces sp. V4I23 TaxID=3042282 RepID=UPI00358F319E
MKKSSTLCAPPFLAGLIRRVPCTKAPLIFHPLEGDTRRPASAVALCHGCPVTSECRQWAREHGEFGIWGGETDDERKAVRYRSRAKGAARSKPQPVRRVEAPAPAPARENGWRPYLSPSEELVLDYLRAGYDRESMTTELRRSKLAVSRAIGGLCRKLCTSEAGIVLAARAAGLFLTSQAPVNTFRP